MVINTRIDIFFHPTQWLQEGFVVKSISATQSAFSALKSDGSVITWGDPNTGGDSNQVQVAIASDVVDIISNALAFAALKNDGSVTAWGMAAYGGDTTKVNDAITSGVIRIYASHDAFAALKRDGSVVTWGGGFSEPGESTLLNPDLNTDILTIATTTAAFAALRKDGTVVTWGNNMWGGNRTHLMVSIAIFEVYTPLVIFLLRTKMTVLSSPGAIILPAETRTLSAIFCGTELKQ